MKLTSRHRHILIAVGLLAPACQRSGHHSPPPTSAATATFDASVATRWMSLLYDVVKSNPGLSPPVASRAYGYAGVALYEAVVPGMPTHQSLAGQLNGLAAGAIPQPDGVVDYREVANIALSTVIQGGIVPNISIGNSGAADTLESTITTELSADVDADVLQRSSDLGAAIGAAILTWVADDGFTLFNNCPYTPPTGGPGSALWVPLAGQTALQPCWDLIRPFVLIPASGCNPGPHPTYSEVAATPFWNEANEVYTTTGDAGASLTGTQTEIAWFWADGPSQTGTPPGHWVSIAAQICDTDDETLATAAEAFSKLGIAVADAFISCWQAKYQYNLLRPITYIQRVIDANWDPLLSTPAFPEYTSGHSVQSGAAATVLTDVFGPRSFNDDTHNLHADSAITPHAPNPRSFADFDTAASEAAISRLYGGIHFRSAIDNGVAQGNCVGNEVLAKLHFLKD